MTKEPAPQPESNILGSVGTERGMALTLAVVYHGMACLAEGSVPAGIRTIIHTAEVFEAHLHSEPLVIDQS